MTQTETAQDFRADIPLSLAQAAHSGTSFVPEKRAEQERDGYAQTLQADWESLSKLANTDEKRATLAAEFERYRAGLRKRTLAQLGARSRCVSTMIAGPSNFPARRMELRNRIEHKRLEELLDFRKRALDAIRKTLCPELRPIMSGDADAVERLTKEIADAEAMQERMKAANAAIRKHEKEGPEAQVFAIVALGYSEKNARSLIDTKPGDWWGKGFPPFRLTNNGANIRRMKKRLEQITRAKATPETVVDGANARLEDCPPENRIRLFFPGKPDEETRDKLKRNGFRWTPSLGCWQAYRNNRSLPIAREIAGY